MNALTRFCQFLSRRGDLGRIEQDIELGVNSGRKALWGLRLCKADYNGYYW